MIFPGRRSYRGLAVALGVSLAAHFGFLLAIGPLDPFADLDVELAVPTEIEFGVSGSMIESPPPPEPAPEEAATTPAAVTPESAADEAEPDDAPGKKDAAVDSAVADASVDAGLDAAEDAALDGGVDAGDAEIADGGDAEVADGGDAGDAGDDAGADASVDASALVADAKDGGSPRGAARSSLEGPSTLAPGAQIALRLDLARVRESALAPAVTRFLGEIPDFHLLLDGTGIDLMNDLDRLYLATPDPFDRSRFVYAGRHVHDEAWAREAVARLGATHGETVLWSRQRGVWVAPWFANDGHPRIVALLGPHHFVVCRHEDLRAVLAYMQVRVERGPDGQRQPSTTGADALFALGEGEALGVEVEGLRQYVRRATIPVPETARVAIREEDGGVVAVVRAAFADEEAANAGQEFWDRQRENVARSSFLRFTAFGPTIASAHLVQDDQFVSTETSLTQAQTEALLTLIQANVANLYRMRPPPPAP